MSLQDIIHDRTLHRALMVSLQSKYNCWNKRRLHYVNPKRRSMSVRDKYDGGPYWHLYNIEKQNTSSFRGIAAIEILSSDNVLSLYYNSSLQLRPNYRLAGHKFDSSNLSCESQRRPRQSSLSSRDWQRQIIIKNQYQYYHKSDTDGNIATKRWDRE